MTDKVTLTDLSNLQNENTAIAAINNNNAAITTAIDNTLSRDGTSPNQMGAVLDMDGHAIINCPSNFGREKLDEDRNYYVATDGDDDNDGLTAATPFLTIQKGIDTTYTLDLNGHYASVIVADGTYNEDLVIRGPHVGGKGGLASLYMEGNLTGNYDGVIINSTGNCIYVAENAYVGMGGFKLISAAGSGINVTDALAYYFNMNFGACAVNQVSVVGPAQVSGLDNNIISGNSASFTAVYNYGFANFYAGTVLTLVGPPNFSRAFFHSESGNLDCEVATFVGTATGKKFDAVYGGIITPGFGSDLSVYPGDQAGIIDDTSYYNQLGQFSSRNGGTVSSGTFTPDPGVNVSTQPAVRRFYYTNNGAHTFGVPPLDGRTETLVTNGASAGSITFSGYTVKASPGDALNTTNTNKFLIETITINAISTYRVYALQ